MIFIPCEGLWSNTFHVKYLSLRFCIHVRNFAPLRHMVRLERLDMFCTNVSDEDLLEFIPKELIGINLGYCDRLTSPGILREFLLMRRNLRMVGLAALNQTVNDDVSVK